MKSKKAEVLEVACNDSCQGLGNGGNLETLVEEYKLPVIRSISTGNLRYSMMIIANSSVLYTQKLLRE